MQPCVLARLLHDLMPERVCSCPFMYPNDRNGPNTEGSKMAALYQIAFYCKAGIGKSRQKLVTAYIEVQGQRDES